MTITKQTPLRTTETHGTEDQAKASLVQPDAKDLEAVHALWQRAPTVKLDAATCWDQICTETYDQGTPLGSVRWNNDLNPAGIGIPQDSTVQPFPITSATEAIKIYLACMNRLVAGTAPEPWYGDINQQARQWIESVWKTHCDAATKANVVVKTVGDLCTHYPEGSDQASTWAWR